MNKVSYKNKEEVEHKPIRNLTLSIPEPDSYFKNSGGRGFTTLFSRYTDEDPLSELLIELGDESDRAGMYGEANFCDFLIKKVAENNNYYFEKFGELLSKIYEASKLNADRNIKRVTEKFYKKYNFGLQKGMSAKDASRTGYNSALIEFKKIVKNYELNKSAQLRETDPVYVADQLMNVIKIMITRLKFESRPNAFRSIRNKLEDFNVIEMSNKRAPGGAVIGVSLALIKNMLNARDPYFINMVVDELKNKLGY